MGNALTVLSTQNKLDIQILDDFIKLYHSTASELAICAQRVPGESGALDEDSFCEEAVLLDIQAEILNYVANAHIDNVLVAEALARFWWEIASVLEQDCSAETNKLAHNIISFYQNNIKD